MRNSILFLLIFIVGFYDTSVYAQIVAFENPEAELQRARIGLVDEFMKRFNGEESHPDIELNKRDSLDVNLLWLFEQSQFMKEDIAYQDSIRTEALNFLRAIQNNSVKLCYSDTTWTAIAHCKGLVMGKQEYFDIFLTVQDRGDDMYKWVINAIDGECFNVKPDQANENLIISPDAHETKFISLRRITKEQPNNIKLYLKNNIEYDQTSVFIYLVYSGKLKIEYVESLEFVFLQVPGYAFHIQYFDNQSNNSGWLISNFYRFSDSDKAAFRKMINQVDSRNEFTNVIGVAEDSLKLADNTLAADKPDSFLKGIIATRINERIKLLQDYISFINSDNTEKYAKNFYMQKLTSLFTPDANVIIKDSLIEETKVMRIDKFVKELIRHKFDNLAIDAVTSVIVKPSNEDNNKVNILGTGIIPISIVESEEILSTICDKMLPFHSEDTEDGIEYLFDFGDLYVTLKKE